MRCLKDRTDYAMNGEKTDEGKYISSYHCNPELVDLEFAQAKKEYLHKTWRQPKGDVIAYQIRQSFKPGEITPEEANEVGYETGMRFTKGKHAFIVATHVDRAHIHNHIIFNSTNLECDRKFRDFWFSGIALQRLSDIICLEHGLSVIPKVKPSERQRRTKYPERVFRFLCRLFLRLGQPLPDGGLFLTAHFPAGKLLKRRCDGIRVPAFEKDQVTGLFCGGVLLQGKIHMVFLRHTGESLDILVTDLDIGKTGVLDGKLFKALPAAVDFWLLAFPDFHQELFDGLFKDLLT